MVSPSDVGHISQINETLRAQAAASDKEITKFLLGLKFPGRVDGDVFLPQTEVPRFCRHVFGSKGLVDILGGDTEFGHLFAAHLHIDRFRHDTVKNDPFHVLGLEQLTLEELGVFVNLFVGIALPGDSHVDPIDITKVIINHRGAGTGWELCLKIIDLTSQFVPHLGK